MKKLRITANQQTSDIIHIDFQFLGLPTIINSNYILGTNLDETTFDNFIEPIDKAIKKATRLGKISISEMGSSQMSGFTQYRYLFNVLDDDGEEAYAVGCMLRVSLHEWGTPSGPLSDSDRINKRQKEVQKHIPKSLPSGSSLIFDYSCNTRTAFL